MQKTQNDRREEKSFQNVFLEYLLLRFFFFYICTIPDHSQLEDIIFLSSTFHNFLFLIHSRKKINISSRNEAKLRGKKTFFWHRFLCENVNESINNSNTLFLDERHTGNIFLFLFVLRYIFSSFILLLLLALECEKDISLI